ncbi:glycosyltransferase family 39 protein [Burkholderia multivorans]|jgi:4-amino-4-deoxy-L-arabinose transferase-like glycosyltransferase|uniref:glycosyltransferase family 39 protein n=1 Tax=Burkholderia multivorans TaxID=87883 RepID=UPI00057C6971|nr:glycosyltransferase family 39 protein [Burkholderia multivorans]KHS14039.1 4-amino-4-deoxy-L-arabinose transferase [Burkholderia multivorans]KHS17124.1 4-amino-4-deoxy-L-arabinose transferase [Burkholderia multivorans]MBR7922592.1 glycosyltransferase family 39 protein [Burkholderia multivorans]MBR8106300.1 glycosyltransferase family 39 protein [Burkholderia multivorans]MBR8337093.1 glycosyltransferase family 39 protein [Burkholderia multivorans]
MNDTPSRLPLNRIVLVLLLVAFAVIWFTPLGMRHLIPSDEGRYAEMAREMFVTGDWITPRYNGYKYFEKPPLQTWLNALTFAWFGIGEWQARLYTALASFAGVLLVGFTGARLFNPLSGFLAAVVLASSPYWNLMGHFNALDMGLAFWMALSLCALLLAQRPGLRPAAVRGWMWLCWAAMAFAVLSKGLVGVILPGAVLVLYTLIARDWALWKRLYLVSGLVLFFAIATPWFVLVQQRNPEFFNFFFIVQQFRRYLTPEQNRPGPFYYFVPVLLVGFLPWLSVAWQSVRHALRMPRQPNGFSPMLVLLIWSAFIFLFFSASHSKLISYVLPVAPALALIIGAYLPLLGADRFRRHLLGYLVFFVAAAFGIIFLAYQGDARTPNALYRAFQIWLYVGLAIAAVLTLVAAWLNRRTGVTAALAAFGAAWLIFGTIGGTGHDEFGRYSSGALLAPAVRAELAKLPPDTPFYSIEMLDHTFPFYVGHTTIMVHRQDELAFGISVEPNKWVPTVDEWIARWKQDTHALAIMPPGEYDALVKQQVPMRVIARDNRRVIVEKPQS